MLTPCGGSLYVSVGAHPLTDANALEAIRQSIYCTKAVDDGHNLEARGKWHSASTAGMAFNSAGLGTGSRAGAPAGRNPQSAARRLQHILLPIVEVPQPSERRRAFARIAQAMGVENACRYV